MYVNPFGEVLMGLGEKGKEREVGTGHFLGVAMPSTWNHGDRGRR